MVGNGAQILIFKCSDRTIVGKSSERERERERGGGGGGEGKNMDFKLSLTSVANLRIL